MKTIKREVLKEWNEEFPLLKLLKVYNFCGEGSTGLYIRYGFFIIGLELESDRWTGESYEPIIRFKGLWYNLQKLDSEQYSYPSSVLSIIKEHCLLYTAIWSDISSVPFKLNNRYANEVKERIKQTFGNLLGQKLPASRLLKSIQDYYFKNIGFLKFDIERQMDWLIFKMALATYLNDKTYKEAVEKEIRLMSKKWNPENFSRKFCMSIEEWHTGLSSMFDKRDEFMKKINEISHELGADRLNEGTIINDLDTLNGNYYPLIKSGPIQYIKDLFQKIIH